MSKVSHAVLLAAIVFFTVSIASSQTFVYERVLLDPTPATGEVSAECIVTLENAPAAVSGVGYPGVGATCSADGPNGPQSSPECPDLDASRNPTEADCQITLPLTPNYPYSASGNGYLFLFYDPDEEEYEDPLDFDDYNWACGFDGEEDCAITPDSNGYVLVDAQFFTFSPPNPSMYLTTISVNPTSANLFQSQPLSLDTNINDAIWCLQKSVGTCGPSFNGIPIGTLQPDIYSADSAKSVNAFFIAPASVSESGSNSFLEAACAQDSVTSENWACSTLKLNQLAVTLGLSPGFSNQPLPGQIVQFVGSIQNTPLDVSWDWSLSPQLGSGQVASTCASNCIAQDWNYTAPFGAGGSTVLTATATVTLPSGAKLDASGTATINLQPPPTITITPSATSIPGILGTLISFSSSASWNGSKSAQWSLSGAANLLSCNGLSTPTLSCTVVSQPSVTSSVQVNVCYTIAGDSHPFCPAAPTTIQVTPAGQFIPAPTFSLATCVPVHANTASVAYPPLYDRLTISDTNAGAAIHYTTNGTTPTAASSLYSGPVTLYQGATTTVEAIAIENGSPNSTVTSATYVLPKCGNTKWP